MTRSTYPHTIENGSGESITFLRKVPGRTGDRLEVENVVKPGAGPPMHVHHHQEEALTVKQGRIVALRTELLVALSQFTADAAWALAHLLHPDRVPESPGRRP